MKKICMLLTILLFSFITVNASSLNLDAKGSLDITIAYSENEKVEGANIQLYKIASLVLADDGNIEYKYVDELSGETFKLNDLIKADIKDSDEQVFMKSIEAAKKIDISNLEPIKEGKTDSNGNIKFDNLSLGLYLVKQSNKVEGYTSIESYLVTIPGFEDNNWVYDINSLPKPGIEKVADLVIKKVWNNNSNKKEPNSITVNIYNDKELFETVEITKENDWTITLEDIPYSDSYRVEEINIPKGYKVTYAQDGLFDFTIVNTNKLPQTGSFTFIIPIFVLFGLLLILVGYCIDKKVN